MSGSRILIDPPRLECPRCGGEDFAVRLRVTGEIRERHNFATGEMSDNIGMWDEARTRQLKIARCADCGEPVGRVLNYDPPSLDRPIDAHCRRIRRTVRIVTLAYVVDGRMMLVKKTGLDYLIQPGGKRERQETGMETLARELHEELGCRPRRPRLVGSFRDVAAGDEDVDVEVTVYEGSLIGNPRPQAEIEAIHWINMARPEIPVAPSLANLIFPFLLARDKNRSQ